MIEITQRLPHGSSPASTELELALPFEARQKSRLRTRLENGEEASLVLPRGEILRGGDTLLAADGRAVKVVASPERLLHIECDTPSALARAAYHLGNRHVAVEVGAGYLRIAADHVLQHMLVGLGARVCEITAPFEPEAGAYAGHTHGTGGHHHPVATGSAARIHEYTAIGRHRTLE